MATPYFVLYVGWIRAHPRSLLGATPPTGLNESGSIDSHAAGFGTNAMRCWRRHRMPRSRRAQPARATRIHATDWRTSGTLASMVASPFDSCSNAHTLGSSQGRLHSTLPASVVFGLPLRVCCTPETIHISGPTCQYALAAACRCNRRRSAPHDLRLGFTRPMSLR